MVARIPPRGHEARRFHVTVEKTVKVPTMRQGEELAFAETDDVQVVQMPYRGGDFAMVVVLPKRADGLDAVEKGLTAAGFDAWLAKSEPRDVVLSLPKFRSEASLDLTRPLAALGMKAAFSPSADFSGIAEGVPLWISSVSTRPSSRSTRRGPRPPPRRSSSPRGQSRLSQGSRRSSSRPTTRSST